MDQLIKIINIPRFKPFLASNYNYKGLRTEPIPQSPVPRSQTIIIMKKSLILLPVLGLLIAGCSDRSPKPETAAAPDPTLSEKAVKVAEQVKDASIEAAADIKKAAVGAKDAVVDKLVEWKLTPADLKADLEKSGRVVRTKSVAVGEKVETTFDNARIVTLVNTKLVTDRDLSALKINVDADKGVVTLNGTVKSVDLIGRAIVLSLDTEGVTEVVSLLKVEESAEPKSM